jgi:hypothetical protein
LRYSHAASEMASLHPAPTTVLLRWLSNHWALRVAPSNVSSMSAWVVSDSSTLRLEPKGNGSDSATHIPTIFDGKHVAALRPKTGIGALESVDFVYSTDMSIPLPTPAGYSRSQAALSNVPGTSTTGRYLGDLVAACTSVAQCNHGRHLVHQKHTVLPYPKDTASVVSHNALNSSSTNIASRPGLYPHKLIRCSSTIAGLGVFTALVDGTVKCSFDDRTIASLRPSPGAVVLMANDGWLRNDADSIVELIDRTANRRCFRLSQVHPGNDFFPYINALLAFSKYAELPEEARQQLAGPGSDEGMLASAPDYAKQTATVDVTELQCNTALVNTQLLLRSVNNP